MTNSMVNNNEITPDTYHDDDDGKDDTRLYILWALGITFGIVLIIIGVIGTMREIVAFCLDCIE